MTLGIPSEWVDEHSRASNPGLFDPVGLERHVVVLSWAGNFPWVGTVDQDDVAADLAAGLRMEERHGRDGNRYYVISGSRYHVFVQERPSRMAGEAITLVTNVKLAGGLSRAVAVRPSGVRFVREETWTPCSPEEVLRAYQEALAAARRRRAAVDRARSGLRQVVEQTRTYATLRGLAHRRYQPLRLLLKLLRQRSELEERVEGEGVARDTGDNGDGTVLWIDLPRTDGFREGSGVDLHHAGTILRRLRIQTVEGRQLAVSAPQREVPAGSSVRVRQEARFAMKRHADALLTFLDEEVEGDWTHLAQLLCQPARLPAPVAPTVWRWFDDELDTEQRAAVTGAVGTPHAFVVQGPPGTGKTRVITEVVRQCVARGERVLLLAPMHVAVDEVLRRVGDQPGVLAMRVSWDPGRVREDLRRFLPERVADTYLRRGRRPAASRAARWRAEADGLRRRAEAVDVYLAARRDLAGAEERLAAAVRRYRTWQQDLTGRLGDAEQNVARADRELARLDARLPQATADVERLRTELDEIPLPLVFWYRLMEVFGVHNALSELLTAMDAAVEEHRRLTAGHRKWSDRMARARADLTRLTTERAEGEPAHQAAVAEHRAARETAAGVLTAATAALTTATGYDPDRIDVAELERRHADLVAGVTRCEHRIGLERRWFELSGLTDGSADGLLGEFGADVVRSANLVCCTTTGLGRSLDDIDFDTLIVDEASRVTDSEFLIGAVRARRWILVGDEHQLPPYVESTDEHHLHALAVLSAVERDDHRDLDTAVDHLGALWVEDEELHQFRTDNVRRTAELLRRQGTWREHYRADFHATRRRLRSGGADPERTLLTAMREHLVQSLFERIVGRMPAHLRQALRTQRRMIEPIAELVRQPVYGGAYLTPRPAAVPPLRYGPTRTPIVFADTSPYGQRARDRQEGSGFVNDLEVETVRNMCRSWEQRLARSGGEPVSTSVLTFYRAQAAAVRAALGGPRYPDFRLLRFQVVDAIDKIQGQESDLVFLSFVRTHLGRGTPSPRYGRWLQDVRRLNVACTRARRGLVLVGHAPTLRSLNGVPKAEAFYANLFDVLDNGADAELVRSPR
ncbi:hypothetical protein CA850_01485 [Micromonospora echinospora]|uniref:AAA domain-containing protein n=1 Tax=Micromonospora echinospora TaxID=1877 RepID=A0A1C4YAR3_MICEC|nr:AAA domain-containing protein [Micromonospora echinospora]OZV84550.1 hypothetical protein CA850_01485 [Micromonospora echinospora]SCF17421.1 AAA domain-containing protein [Micromonospora echinospora]